jgi:metal-responsive CopG/Arc/MetJ family transcriptional regulator
LDKELLDKISKLSEHEGIDRMAWIRRALANFVNDEEDGMSDAAIEDYINLRIDEKEMKDYTGFKKIPEDIREARKKVLSKIVGEKK